MMRLGTIVIAALLASVTAAQPQPAAFQVASVKANRSDEPIRVGPVLQPGGRVFALNLPLQELIRVAYGLQENQLIASSPLLDARFDLEARAESTATREQTVLMLRALLADRFALKTHTETRQLPVYELHRVDAARLGPRIKPSGAECAALVFPSGPDLPPPPPPPPPAAMAGTPLDPDRMWAGCPTMFFPGGLSARKMDMSAFAVALARMVRRPVVDRTALTGAFDFDMSYSLDSDGAPPSTGSGNSAPALPTALKEQLGLRFESSRAPVDVLVVDRVQQPADN
jgi:uncharacterized protein (TIGR03435 family)